MIKERLQKFISSVVLFFYIVTLVPATELKFSMEKSLSRLDFYLENAHNARNEDAWQTAADNAVLSALKDWEAENIHLKETDGDLWKKYFEEAKNVFELEKNKNYARWIFERSFNNENFESVFELRERIKENSTKLKAGTYSLEELNEKVKKIEEDNAQIIEEYVKTYTQKYLSSATLLEKTSCAAEVELQMLSKAEENRLFLEYSMQKKDDADTDSAQTAGILSDILSKTTQEETSIAMEELFNSLEKKIEAEKTNDAETQELLSRFKEVFNSALSVWEKAETDFLVARSEWEEEAENVYLESENLWIQAFETLQEKKTEWKNSITERISLIQEKIKAENLSYETSLEQSLSEYAAILTEEASKKYENSIAVVNIYSSLRNSLCVVYEGIVSLCSLMEKENSQKYRGLYSYWKTENNENVGNIDEDACRKIEEIIKNSDLLKEDSKADSFLEWFEQAKTYNQKIESVREQIFELSLEKEFEEENLGELELELIRLNSLKKYWQEELEVAEAIVSYLENEEKTSATKEEIYEKKKAAEENYNLAAKTYEDSLIELNSLSVLLSQEEEKLADSYEKINQAYTELEEKRAEYEKLYAENLETDEKTLVQILLSYIENYENAEKTKLENQSNYYEKLCYELEKSEYEQLESNEQKIKAALKNSAESLENLKNELLQTSLESETHSSVFDSFLEKAGSFFSEINLEKLWNEQNCIYNFCSEEFKTLKETLQQIDFLSARIKSIRAEEEKTVSTSPLNSSLDELVEFAVLKAQAVLQIEYIENIEKIRLAQLYFIADTESDGDDEDDEVQKLEFLPDFSNLYWEIDSLIDSFTDDFSGDQEEKSKKLLKTYSVFEKEIYTEFKNNTENFIHNADSFKFSEIQKNLENTKTQLFNLLQKREECNANGYDNVIDYCIKIYDFLEEGNAGKSCSVFIENFFDSYLKEQAFYFANFFNDSSDSEKINAEEKIAALTQKIESKEALLEADDENTFTSKDELTQYLKSKIELKFLIFYKTEIEESEVEWKKILAQYDFAENKFVDSTQKEKIKTITQNFLQNQLSALKENTRLAADVFGVGAEERSNYSSKTLSALDDSYENYELSLNSIKKYQTKIEGLAQKFEKLNSSETIELLNKKLSEVALAEQNYKNAIEFYESQTKEFVSSLEKYNEQIELSNNLYDRTEKARIERRKTQSVYDWAESLYLENSSYENYGDFKSPQEERETAFNALNGINLVLETLEKIKESDYLKDDSFEQENEAESALVEADRNYYLSYVLYSDYLSAIQTEKKSVLLSQENEKYYRTALVKTLEENDFVYSQFARVEYDSSLEKYVYSLCSDSFNDNEEAQRKFFLEKTDSFSVISDSGEYDATAAEKEISVWLTEMCQDESLFKTIVLAGLYWLSENDPSFENSIYSSALNTHAQMGDAHGIGADDYYKKYIKQVAESSFNELKSKGLTEEIAKCVLFRNSNSIFAENIQLIEKNLVKSLAFELVENKMNSRKNDSDCTVWIIRFFTNIRVQNAKGRAAKNYSKSAQALKNSTFKIYENSFADILSAVKNLLSAQEQTDLAFEKYSKKTGGIYTDGQEKYSTDFVKNFFIQDFAQNSLLDSGQIQNVLALLKEDESFESIEEASEILLKRHFLVLSQKNEEFEEINSTWQEEHQKKIENFRNNVEFLLAGDNFAGLELEKTALDAFGNKNGLGKSSYSFLFDYYKKYLKEGRTFAGENFNRAESEYFIFSNSLETFPVLSSESELNYREDFFSRYLEFYEELQTVNTGFELASKKLLLDSSLNSIKKENEDNLNRLLQISFIADNEWQKAEEKLNSTYNSWARDFSKNYTKANEEWKNSYEEFLSEKQQWISQMYASASLEAGLVFSAGEKAEEALKNSIQKAKIAEINSVERLEIDSTSFVNQFLKDSILYSLKEHFGELEGRAGQSVFYSKINAKKSAGTALDYYNAKKAGSEISQLMQETSAKLYAQKYSQNIEQNIEDSFNLVEEANRNFEGEIKNLVYAEGYDWQKEEISRKVLVHSYFFNDEYKKQTVHVFNWFKTERPSISFSTSILNGLSAESLIQFAQTATQQIEEWKNRIFGIHTKDKDEDGEFEIHIGSAPDNSSLKNGSGELGLIYSDIFKNNEEMLAGLSEMEAAPWDKKLTASPVSWVEVPSLRTVCTVATAVAASVVSAALSVASFGTLAAPLAALCAAGVSAALTTSTETAFAIMDLNGNYKDWDEVAKNLGTSVAVSSISAIGGVAGSALNLSSAAGTAVAKSSIDMFSNAAGTLASTAIQNAGNWNDFEKSFNSFGTWASVVSGGAGSLVTNYLNTVNLDGFNSAQIGTVKRFNSLAGGLTGNAFDFAFTGNTTFNVLNLADLKGLSVNANSGLVEMHAGKGGISFSLGTKGTDIGRTNLNLGFNGLSLYSLNKKIENTADTSSIPLAATSLRSLSGFGGVEENKLLENILNGKTRLALSGDDSYFAKTVADSAGLTIYVSGYKNEMSREEQLQLGIILSHESFRNGITDNKQIEETLESVAGHTRFAQNMKNDSLYTQSVENILSDGSSFGILLKKDLEYFKNVKENPKEFVLHVIQNYDSSADYWKLLENGNIAFDGKTHLYDEAGNILYEANAKGLESSLVEILLGGKEATAVQLEEIRNMMAEVFEHYVVGEDKDNKDNWYWNAEVLEQNKKSEGLSGEKVFEKFGNTIVSQAFARYFDGSADRVLQFLYGNSENFNAGNVESRAVSGSSIVRFIDLVCEKNNFYKNLTSFVKSSDAVITGNFRDKVEGAYANYNGEHFGIDIGGKNIEGQEIFAGINGRVVSSGSTERDGNSLYIEYGYEFEGQFVSSGLKGEYLHMQEKSLLKRGERVSASDIVGKVGNTGTASTGPHLHYSIFTEIKNGKSWYSKSVGSMLFGQNGLNDSMTNNTGTKTVFNPSELYENSKTAGKNQNGQKKDSNIIKIIDYANTIIKKKKMNRRVETFLANGRL